MSSFLSQVDSQFNAEIRLKQDLIDRTNATIQSLSTQQRNLTAHLTSLQHRTRLRAERHQRILNLHSAIKDQRARLTRTGAVPLQKVMDAGKENVDVGDADSAADTTIQLDQLADAALSTPEELDNLDLHHLTPLQQSIIRNLPSAEELRASVSAYRTNNGKLQAQAAALKARNGELEQQLRKVVALCTGVEEDMVEHLLGGLLKAVESETGEGVEVGRVREFLRKVDFVEG